MSEIEDKPARRKPGPKPGTRPNNMTVAWKERYLNHLCRFGFKDRARRSAHGVSHGMLKKARETDAEFAKAEQDAIAFARDVQREQLEEEIHRRGYKGYDRPIYQGGKLVGKERTYSDMLAMFRMKKLDTTYRDNAQIIIPPTPPSNHPPTINIAIVTPEQSRALHDVLKSIRGPMDAKPVASLNAPAHEEAKTVTVTPSNPIETQPAQAIVVDSVLPEKEVEEEVPIERAPEPPKQLTLAAVEEKETPSLMNPNAQSAHGGGQTFEGYESMWGVKNVFFNCSVCRFPFESQNALNDHQSKGHDYQCAFCSKSFSSEDVLNHHKLYDHDPAWRRM